MKPRDFDKLAQAYASAILSVDCKFGNPRVMQNNVSRLKEVEEQLQYLDDLIGSELNKSLFKSFVDGVFELPGNLFNFSKKVTKTTLKIGATTITVAGYVGGMVVSQYLGDAVGDVVGEVIGNKVGDNVSDKIINTPSNIASKSLQNASDSIQVIAKLENVNEKEAFKIALRQLRDAVIKSKRQVKSYILFNQKFSEKNIYQSIPPDNSHEFKQIAESAKKIEKDIDRWPNLFSLSNKGLKNYKKRIEKFHSPLLKMSKRIKIKASLMVTDNYFTHENLELIFADIGYNSYDGFKLSLDDSVVLYTTDGKEVDIRTVHSKYLEMDKNIERLINSTQDSYGSLIALKCLIFLILAIVLILSFWLISS